MKKKNIILLSTLFIVAFGYIFIVYLIYGSRFSSKGYIIVSSLGGYYCDVNKCKYQSLEEINSEDKKFEVYQRNKSIGEYRLSYVGQWNFFQNNNWKGIYGDFLAIESNLKSQVIDFQYEDMTEEDYKDISHFVDGDISHLNNNSMIVVDLDENGVEDRIGMFSNQVEEYNGTDYFSLAYLKLNGKLIEIYKDTGKNTFSLPYYNLFSILKLNEEKNPRLIINKGYYDSSGVNSIVMLQLDKKELRGVVLDSAK